MEQVELVLGMEQVEVVQGIERVELEQEVQVVAQGIEQVVDNGEVEHHSLAEKHDDDVRRWSQVQGIHGLLYASYEERGIHVLDEGSRSQCSERSCWSRCLGWIRQIQGAVHCFQNSQRLSTPAISVFSVLYNYTWCFYVFELPSI